MIIIIKATLITREDQHLTFAKVVHLKRIDINLK